MICEIPFRPVQFFNECSCRLKIVKNTLWCCTAIPVEMINTMKIASANIENETFYYVLNLLRDNWFSVYVPHFRFQKKCLPHDLFLIWLWNEIYHSIAGGEYKIFSAILRKGGIRFFSDKYSPWASTGSFQPISLRIFDHINLVTKWFYSKNVW